MDICNFLSRGANSFDNYIEITQELKCRFKDEEIPCSKCTVLCLKKLCNLEIKYFNKYDDSGAAFEVVGRMLDSSQSSSKDLLHLACLIRYWLDVARKHLIINHIHWWNFTAKLLGFIKKTHSKDSSLSNKLVEELAESMLDLATSGKSDIDQRYSILHTFNIISAESSREVRLALRTGFEHYFIRLAAIMSSCGHFGCQFTILESLLRWLQPRNDPAVRADAANKWLPAHLYSTAAKQIFLTSNWQNFYQDARDFLNNHNDSGDLITSAICRRLSVGRNTIVSGSERLLSWVDINRGNRSVGVLLQPAQLAAIGVSRGAGVTLSLTADSVTRVHLHRESYEVKISIVTSEPPIIVPTKLCPFEASDCDVTIVISSHTNLMRVDAALGFVFQDNYKLLMDIHDVPLSPSRSRNDNTDEKTRFSHPQRPNRRIIPGFMTKSRRPLSLRTPSTASTSSLGQLHQRLENLDYHNYNKERVSISTTPDLSVVRELTEEISNSLENTGCNKFRQPAVNYFPDRKAQSDGEAAITPQPQRTIALQQEFFKGLKGSQSDDETIKSKLYHRTFIHSSLRELSVSSAEQTILDATLEVDPKDKIDADHLRQKLQDVFHANQGKDKLKDSGINTGEERITPKKQSGDSEVIEDTQYAGLKTVPKKTKKNTTVRKSTSDESNTEAVNEIPNKFITVRKKNRINRSSTEAEAENPNENNPENATFDVKAVEDFFSQHFAENRAGDLVISPTLAKKINETSSECSEDYLMNLDNEFILNNDEMPDLEIVDCLNDIVDQVCHDFDKCSKYLNKVACDKTEDLEEACYDYLVNKDSTTQNNEKEDMHKNLQLRDVVEEKATVITTTKKSRSTKSKSRNTKPINNETSTDQIKDLDEEIPLLDVVNELAKVETTTTKKTRLTKPRRASKKPVNNGSSTEGDQIGDIHEEIPLRDLVNEKAKVKTTRLVKPRAGNTTSVNNGSSTEGDQIEDIHEEIPLRDVVNEMATVKTTKKKSGTIKTKRKPGIKLTFPNKKQKAKAKLLLEPVSKMSTIIEDNNENDVNKTTTSDVVEDKQEIVTDPKKTPLEESKTKLAKRKRKLYSPKDDQKMFDHSDENEMSVKPNKLPYSKLSDDDDDVVLADIKNDNSTTPKSIATCYKDLEKDRQNHRLRTRKNKNKQSPPSPKTAKLNDMFEHLKDNIENHEITMVDKKSDKDVAIFNFTSDSEDEDFKQKKAELQKRTSTTTVGSCTSIVSTRRGRSKKKVDYSEDSKDNKEITEKPKRKRVTRSKKSKPKTKEITIDQNELIDERMREAPPEELNTSFNGNNVEQPNDNVAENIPEPAPIIKEPELEVLDNSQEDKLIEESSNEVKENAAKEKKDNNTINTDAEKDTTCNKKEESRQKRKRTVNKQENIIPLQIIKDDDRTVSPLPGLVIETEAPKSYREESLTTNLIEKFQKIYKDPDAYNDTTVTQNMLSDNDKPGSPRMNITEELGVIGNDDFCEKAKRKRSDDKNSDTDVINDTIQSDNTQKKANSTVSNKKSKRNRLRLKERTDSSVTSNSIKDIPIKKRASKIIHPKKETNELQDNSQRSNKITRSQIENVIVDEIVCLDIQRTTRSRSAKSASKSREIKTIDISSTCEIKSEKSIATVGITAHGDQDELPPSTKMLNERLSPRELTDMDQSVRDYYVQLNREVNTSKESNESNVRNAISEKSQKDIVKSKTDSSSQSAKSRCKRFEYDSAKWLPSARETESENLSEVSEKVKSPSVSITRLTAQDLAKWLSPIKQRIITTPTASRKSPVASRKRQMVSRNSPISTRNRRVASGNSPMASRNRQAACRISPLTSRKSQIASRDSPVALRHSPMAFKNPSNRKEIERTKPKTRKSQISPINFEDFLTKRNENDTSRSKDDIFNSQSVENLNRKDGSGRYYLRPTHESSPVSATQKSAESTPKAPKRKSPTPKIAIAKRMKVESEIVDISESRQSSHVGEWLNKLSTSYRADNFDASSDTLQNVMEKLDTTLAEIHQNTTKDFISLFVDAQKELSRLAEERRYSYRETAVTMLKEIDRHFAEMEQRASERDSELMGWLKERASAVLRRDCQQKKVLVMLLREDVQAAEQCNRRPRQ